jgi:very-short-patch-repair endonuclease
VQSIEGRLAGALLYAGPGAAVSHTTGAWWWGLLSAQPRVIHVRTPRRTRSRPGLQVHYTKDLERMWHNRLPVTPVAQTLLDLAATCEFDVLRRAVAQADYLRLLDLDAIDQQLGHGRPGAAALRKALRRHRPEYAQTLSPAEDLLLDLCLRHRIPLPEANVWIEGFKVDAIWRAQRVVVEVDGRAAHGTPVRLELDRERDLALRVAGFIVLRYSGRQLSNAPHRVAADIRGALKRPTTRLGSHTA